VADVIRSVDVLRDEFRLALDGWHLTVTPPRNDGSSPLANINLVAGQQSERYAQRFLSCDHSTAEIALLEAMLGYLNSGGNPRRLARLANWVGDLPKIEVTDFKVLNAHGSSKWVSYWQHKDKRIFEVHHGDFACELTQDDIQNLLDIEDDPDGQEEMQSDKAQNANFTDAYSVDEDGEGEEGEGRSNSSGS